MSSLTFNVLISGASVSGDLDVGRKPLVIDLGNSDRIGQATFSLQNKDGAYSATLFSGNALFQIDAMQGNTLVKTVFRGTLERADAVVDTMGGNRTDFYGYDYAQELLGLVSPDARQPSKISAGAMSLTSGDQGMGVLTGMDLALYVSGAIGSGTVGYPVGGYTLGKPLAASISAFMSQYFGKSGDTTGTNSGQSFSFKPYASGMTTWGANPFYRCWYAQDGASDTNSNYWITYHSLTAKQEIAWDVIKKITRQGYAIDRSGTKTQYELYVGVSGDLHLRTSGSSDFIASGISLIYYQAGQSGSGNNNVQEFRSLPWDTTNIKNFIVGWFPTWTTFPFSDDYSDLVAYSGVMWSGASLSGTVTLSGYIGAPASVGMISIQGTDYSGGSSNGIDLVFTLWSGYTLDIQKWNVSGGNGVLLSHAFRAFSDATPPVGFVRNVKIYDISGNYIIKSGGTSNGANGIQNSVLVLSGSWGTFADVIFTTSGTFYSGTGQDGGWKPSATLPDFSQIKQISFGVGMSTDFAATANVYQLAVDSVMFQFTYNFNPIITYSSGSISLYRRRYEVFQFPYQYTDSGAVAVVAAELQGKSYSRQLAQIVVKDNPNLPFSAQLGITPGQAFKLDAPILAAGSGQFYDYWVAASVRHEWDTNRGFVTVMQAYPWFSGATVLSGLNMITYSLTSPKQVQPQVASQMPNTNWWGPTGHRGY